MTIRTVLCMFAIASCCSNAHAQSYRNQDAGVGGLAGAVLGGIIGHQNDETAEGALIGGAVGAIAGGLLGNQKDRNVQQHRYYHQQVHQRAQHQAWQSQQLSRAATINDVVSMSQNGLSDSVILNHIRTNGVANQVGTHEIIAMHKSGVSEGIITAMQSSHQAGTTTVATTLPRRETVIVERTPPPPSPVIVRREVHVVPSHVPHPRVRYATRPAYPQYPSRSGFYRYW